MNDFRLKNKVYLIPIALFFALLMSSPIQAATFEFKKGESIFQLNEDPFFLESPQSFNMQMIEHVKKNYRLVLELINQNKYAAAQVKVNSLLQQDPSQSIYYNLKALLQIVNENVTGAEQSFLKAIELNTRNSQAYSGLAKLALNNKRNKSAKGYANRAIGSNPYEMKAYEILADIAMQEQGIIAVETLLLEARTQVKENLNAELVILQLLGKVYISQKQPEKLVGLAADLLIRNKNNVTALSLLADAQLINNDTSGAEGSLRAIITQQPKDAKHLFLLARVLAKQSGNEREVMQLLDQAAGNLDNPNPVLSFKTAVLIKQKHYQKALAVAKQVEDNSPTNALGKILKADVYLAEKKYNLALKHYQTAYQISADIEVLDAMLTIFETQKQFKKAVALLENELAKEKNKPIIQFRLAVAYQNSGQYKPAVQLYELVLSQQNDNVVILNNLAWIYNELKDPRALSLAKQAYLLAPKSAPIADTYGYLLLQAGKVKESIIILQQAVNIDPKQEEIKQHLEEAQKAQHIR